MLLVLTPTLGKSKYLRRTLESVSRISAPYHHIIVGPQAAVQALAGHTGEAQLVCEPPGIRGMYEALNYAIKSSRIEWQEFTYINDDDYFLSDFPLLVRRGHDLAYGRCLIDIGGKIRGGFALESSAKRLAPLFAHGIVGAQQPGTIISRRLWEECGPFDINLKLNADMDFILRAAIRSKNSYCCKKPVAAFSFTGGQLSANRAAVARENIYIRDKLKIRSSLLSRFYLARFRIVNIPIYLKRLCRGALRQEDFYDRVS